MNVPCPRPPMSAVLAAKVPPFSRKVPAPVDSFPTTSCRPKLTFAPGPMLKVPCPYSPRVKPPVMRREPPLIVQVPGGRRAEPDAHLVDGGGASGLVHDARAEVAGKPAGAQKELPGGERAARERVGCGAVVNAELHRADFKRAAALVDLPGAELRAMDGAG